MLTLSAGPISERRRYFGVAFRPIGSQIAGRKFSVYIACAASIPANSGTPNVRWRPTSKILR